MQTLLPCKETREDAADCVRQAALQSTSRQKEAESRPVLIRIRRGCFDDWLPAHALAWRWWRGTEHVGLLASHARSQRGVGARTCFTTAHCEPAVVSAADASLERKRGRGGEGGTSEAEGGNEARVVAVESLHSLPVCVCGSGELVCAVCACLGERERECVSVCVCVCIAKKARACVSYALARYHPRPPPCPAAPP